MFQQRWQLQVGVCRVEVYFTDAVLKQSDLWGFLFAPCLIVSCRSLYTTYV